MIATKDDIIKDDILKEAQKLFQQYGIRKTTMEDIAKAMGKGKSTLYYYFSSKEEIFDAVVIKEMDEVFDRVRQAVEKAESAEDKLRAYTLTKVRAVQKRANLYKIVKGEMEGGLRCTKHIHTEYDAQEVKLVKNILRFGVKKGEFSKAVGKEIDLLPSVIVSSLRGLERDMAIDTRYAKLEPRLDSIVSILIKGLSSN